MEPEDVHSTLAGVVSDYVEEVEEVLVEVSVDDQLEVAKEEVAARGSRPGNAVGEEAVEVDDHAGDEAEVLPLLRH